VSGHFLCHQINLWRWRLWQFLKRRFFSLYRHDLLFGRRIHWINCHKIKILLFRRKNHWINRHKIKILLFWRIIHWINRHKIKILLVWRIIHYINRHKIKIWFYGRRIPLINRHKIKLLYNSQYLANGVEKRLLNKTVNRCKPHKCDL
jgi:hypothetical protein